MSAYKYANPLEWFNQHIAGLDYEELLSTAREVASKLDGDALQDIFQDDMDKDGYFSEEQQPCGVCGRTFPASEIRHDLRCAECDDFDCDEQTCIHLTEHEGEI